MVLLALHGEAAKRRQSRTVGNRVTLLARIVFVACVLAVIASFSYRASAGDPSPPTTTATDPEPSPDPAPPLLQGRTIGQWHAAAARYLSRWRSLQVALRRDPEVSTAIGLACTVYGHCGELWSKARCESHLYRYAHNPSGASGLFQFLPSTWGSTPFGRYSIFDPYANALGAGWMHAHGRGGEWVCR